MIPFWSDDHLTLYGGDCRAVLATLPAASVHCVVTSPPYWGLRDYGVADQLGLEATPEAYVAGMVEVFREVRRVLRDDGTLWLNLGDSYASSQAGRAGGTVYAPREGEFLSSAAEAYGNTHAARNRNGTPVPDGLKPKDLVGIPWRVAFALQADGWYLRSDIIWAKPNPMPESVTDRPTKAHEYLFLLSKSPRYYYDADAVREDLAESSIARINQPTFDTQTGGPKDYGPDSNRSARKALVNLRERNVGGREDGFTRMPGGEAEWAAEGRGGRNIRSVWSIATEPYQGAHFATFPRKLVEPCVKAGTSERGVCSLCGRPWERLVDVLRGTRDDSTRGDSGKARLGSAAVPEKGWQSERLHVGWTAPCGHTMAQGAAPVPATVLDPFAGSGTTLFVAQALGRRGVGIDLNPEYLEQALARNAQTPLGLVG